MLTENFEMVISPRRHFDYIPHSSLAKGQPVLTAGTLKPEFDDSGKLKRLTINNKSGHFKPTFRSLQKS